MTGLIVAGLALSTVGTVAQFQAQQAQASALKQQGEYTRQIYEYNASLKRQQAGLAKQLAEKNARGQEEQGMIDIGHIRAGMAASGVDVNTDDGSPLDLIGQAAADRASLAEYERWSGDEQAWELLTGATLDESQGRLAEWEASQQAKATRSAAYGSLFAGIGSTALSGVTAYSKGLLNFGTTDLGITTGTSATSMGGRSAQEMIGGYA
ncbi:hypothetical protein dsx2_2646 [Desulfovibrio sp. X2]|uniref:hypothetical protein n=1 Tax=Desulfovibrio sp. X2 TaxID=941449 RepID=UPI000358C846|nr:hypothetical protein [Desulfovibrio sp. X2]EPR42729.1 hypothetical protein dsx2_2646 [Desulfovibrio sp. X2]